MLATVRMRPFVKHARKLIPPRTRVKEFCGPSARVVSIALATQYGNGYVTEFSFDYFQVRMVCGPTGNSQNRSIKSSEASSPPPKLFRVTGSGTLIATPRYRVPIYKGKNRTMMLFGDSHAEYFKFLPADCITALLGSYA